MSDGPASEIPIGEIENSRRYVGILPKEERQRIAESLGKRGIFFGIYPVEGGRDTTRLESDRERIESVGLATVAEVASEMPIKNVSIGFFDKPEDALPEYGIFGRRHPWETGETNSLIGLYFDPESPHRETALGRDLRRQIRHELHHDQRFEALGEDSYKTLLDAIIFEGLATHFEIEGSDDQPSLYATALTSEQIPALLARAREDFASEDATSIDEWHIGSEGKNIPRWTAYALGHYLVSEYLKEHPDKKASTLYALPAEGFVKATLN